MSIQCDKCGQVIPSGKSQACFGLDLCQNCFEAVVKFAHTKSNRSTTIKVLHGLAKVGKAVANSAAESVATKK
jgi:predicted  nucleic acid-binding Zn-ribbon protein